MLLKYWQSLMTTVNKYQIYCITEATWKTVWAEEAPTVCPTDSAHTVNLDSVAIINTVNSLEVTVKQPTDGYFIVEGYQFPFEACTPGEVQVANYSFDETILLWKTSFNVSESMLGDEFSIVINPDTVIGGITAMADIDDTVIHVTSTVTDNVTTGMYVTLDADGSPPYTNICKILAIDKDAGTITIKSPLTESFPPGSIVYLIMYMAKNIALDSTYPSEYGEKGFAAKQIPKGTLLRLYYTNNNGEAKIMNWKVGYYYGLGLD